MAEQRIFITGGASGLGEALAERYAHEKWSVCIGDVHRERGEDVVKKLLSLGVKAQFLYCDVTQDGDMEAAGQWMVKHWGGVNAVVNNAGVAVAGPYEDTSMDDWNWIIDINLLGVVRGCKVFGRIFQKQGFGQFINIASAAGFIHMPRMAAYNATKAAVIALSETLRLEYPNIKVSVVCPTFFKTRLAETMRSGDKRAKDEAAKLVTQSKVPASVIADSIYKAAEKNVFMILPDFNARNARLLKRIIPEPLYFKTMAFQIKQMKSRLGKNRAARTES